MSAMLFYCGNALQHTWYTSIVDIQNYGNVAHVRDAKKLYTKVGIPNLMLKCGVGRKFLNALLVDQEAAERGDTVTLINLYADYLRGNNLGELRSLISNNMQAILSSYYKRRLNREEPNF